MIYKPGGDENWTKDGWFAGDPDVHSETFGLVFIGLDGRPLTSDDSACSQAPNLRFDPDSLFNEATRLRADLGAQAIALAKRLREIYEQVPGRQADLETAKVALKTRMEAKALTSFEQLKQDTVASRWLLLIGELELSRKRIETKIERVSETIELIVIEAGRFDNFEAEERLAERSEDLVTLTVLLDDAKHLLGEDTPLAALDDGAKLSAAEEWFQRDFEK
ncbi:MAG: hypothetical protein K8I27_14905 [Planctomycetes bacterium]|nr:hypothetical protein [Planctomycetota bacterium]